MGFSPETYALARKYTDEHGGGGGTWGSITGTLSDQTDLQNALDGKQATLTFDNVPTNGSNNPVKSDGIYDVINDVYDVMGQNGAVNVCNCTMGTTTLNLVTATKGTTDNGGVKYTITRDDTQTQTAQFLLCNETELLAFFQKHTGEKFRLSGCPSGGDYPNGYSLAIFFNFDGTTVSYADLGEGVEITVPSVVTTARVAITIRTSATLNNTVFTPMIAPASYTGDYVPYAMTNRELTPVDITNEISWTSGVTPIEDYTYLVKMGNLLFLNVTAHKSTAISPATWQTIFSLPYSCKKSSFPVGTRNSKPGFGNNDSSGGTSTFQIISSSQIDANENFTFNTVLVI